MIYLASSMRNPLVVRCAAVLVRAGFEVFWEWYNDREFMKFAEQTEGMTQELALIHPTAKAHFRRNEAQMHLCNRCVLLNPCGNSAHLEAGYMIGRGTPTIIVGSKRGGSFSPSNYDIMYQLATRVFPDLDALEKELCFAETKIVPPSHSPRIRQQLFE